VNRKMRKASSTFLTLDEAKAAAERILVKHNFLPKEETNGQSNN
jgi:hypothetical protein